MAKVSVHKNGNTVVLTDGKRSAIIHTGKRIAVIATDDGRKQTRLGAHDSGWH